MKNTPESPVSKEEKKAAQLYDYIESLDVSKEEKLAVITTVKEFITLTFNKANEVATSAFIGAQAKMFQRDLENSIRYEKFKKHTSRFISTMEDIAERAPELWCKDRKEEYREALHDLKESGYIKKDYKGIEI